MPIQLYLSITISIVEESKGMERKVADMMPCGDSDGIVLQRDHVCMYEGKK